MQKQRMSNSEKAARRMVGFYDGRHLQPKLLHKLQQRRLGSAGKKELVNRLSRLSKVVLAWHVPLSSIASLGAQQFPRTRFVDGDETPHIIHGEFRAFVGEWRVRHTPSRPNLIDLSAQSARAMTRGVPFVGVSSRRQYTASNHGQIQTPSQVTPNCGRVWVLPWGPWTNRYSSIHPSYHTTGRINRLFLQWQPPSTDQHFCVHQQQKTQCVIPECRQVLDAKQNVSGLHMPSTR